ncbi:hypothetical protein D0864_00380 [Hortaea werneckii]|uniref:FAD-binding PCMH-type domain-containing protein n=1 Tax=Hortaea werneckii TaxID=91943 RepID=A0A3M7FT91_HORWE|nr:hypothetical protein D0862_09576 [Hortaea werneckii]RMZ13743.1 hypothetical protein D0864_00380 [Hortaea werneckii]
MNSTTYNPENDTATVQSGALWGSVYSTLDKLGVMVVGGRSASVGTGGLVLGGGNSFYAARKGLVCDNVAQLEVVLGNGEIVHANNQDRSDLFQVLKGGGNNFGIVTAMDLKTFEGGPLWGGNVVYSQSAAPEILSEFVQFADKLVEDPYASLVTYTRPVERPDPFKKLLSIEGKISDSTQITNMTSLSREWEAPNTYSTLTTKNDLRVLTKAHELWLIVVQRLKTEAKGPWEGHQLYQPMPPTFGKDSVAHGGNALGLDRFDETLILYEPYLSWTYAEQDDLFNGQAKWLRDELAAFAKSIGADNEFIYLDYADADQNPLGSYGEENVRKMKAAAKEYDPQGVFQKLQPARRTMSLARSYFLGTAHTLVGVGALFAPLTTARIFGVAAVPATNFVTRLFGCRDLVLGGGVLATVTAPTEQRRIVLLAANIINAIDVFSGLVCYAEGNLTRKALILGSGGATLAFTLGMFEAGAL